MVCGLRFGHLMDKVTRRGRPGVGDARCRLLAGSAHPAGVSIHRAAGAAFPILAAVAA